MARLWQCGKLLMARWIMRGWISQHGISWVSLMWGWLGQLWQWRGGHMTHTWTHDHSGHWPMLSGHGAWPSHYTGSHASTGHWSQGARSITGHRSHRTQYTDLCWAVTLSLARCSPNHWSISTPAPMAVSEWACSLWLRWLQLLQLSVQLYQSNHQQSPQTTFQQPSINTQVSYSYTILN